ncbi:MAG: hypothetical protein D6679_10920 [Candidatus Hydrogenedentota bacterium]|nr:MAG: hypothetical protein D6679_10920 [Candidatus Hydrogenedentota bacterium]
MTLASFFREGGKTLAFLLLTGIIVTRLFVWTGIPRTPVPADLRFDGIGRTVSDLIWLKATARVAWPTRVTARDAERNYHLFRLAAGMNPANSEPYFFGTLAMCMWHRNDLALKFAQEGMKKYPKDRRIRMALFGAVTVFGADLEEALKIVPDLREIEKIPDRSPEFFEAKEILAVFWVMKADQLRKEGKMSEALSLWKRIRRIYGYNRILRERAEREIRLLSKEERGTARAAARDAGRRKEEGRE